MVSAIIYNSQTGSCKRYAQNLSAALHLPVYPQSACPARPGAEVIFVSWALAGKAVGLKHILADYDLAGLVQVGMSPVYPGSEAAVRKANSLGAGIKVFCRQGAFHMDKLPLPFKLIMKLKCREIAGKLAKKAQLSEAEQALYRMASTGEGEPPTWDVADIASAFRVPGGGLVQE